MSSKTYLKSILGGIGAEVISVNSAYATLRLLTIVACLLDGKNQHNCVVRPRSFQARRFTVTVFCKALSNTPNFCGYSLSLIFAVFGSLQ